MLSDRIETDMSPSTQTRAHFLLLLMVERFSKKQKELGVTNRDTFSIKFFRCSAQEELF